MKILKLMLASGAILSAGGMFAQYNPTIDVEGTYKPDIIPQERVNMFPEPLHFGQLPGRLEFDTQGVVTPFTPNGVPMGATGWQDTRAPYGYKGYIYLSAGSWLDARLDAGYRFVETANTIAGVFLSHNSTSLWKPKLSEAGKDIKRRLYNQTLGFYVRHNAGDAGVLDATLDWNSAYFNYYGFIPNEKNTPLTDPTQTFNKVRLDAVWKSGRDRKFKYDLGLDLRYSAFRAMYARTSGLTGPYQNYAMTALRGSREFQATLSFDNRYDFTSSSALGLDLEGSLICYSPQKRDEGAAEFAPDNYGRVVLTPYYEFSHRNVSIKAGPRIDLTFNTRNNNYRQLSYSSGIDSDEKGKVFHISPDVEISYATKGFRATLNVTGGTELNTLSLAHERDFYSQPFILNTKPTYLPVDANLDLAFGPFAGFEANIYASYRNVRDYRTGGWYMAYLNNLSPAALGFEGAGNVNVRNIYYGLCEGVDIKGYSLGLRLAWNYGRLFGISAEGHWQPQSGNCSFYNGYDMPELTARFEINTNPWKTLRFRLGYDLRALRKPLALTSVLGGANPTTEIGHGHLANWSNLHLNADYDIIPALSVGLQLDNLLNRRQEILPSLPVPGFTISGSLSWRF